MKYRYPIANPVPVITTNGDWVYQPMFSERVVEIPDRKNYAASTVGPDGLRSLGIGEAKTIHNNEGTVKMTVETNGYAEAVLTQITTQLFDKAVADRMAPELIRQDRKIERLVEAVRQLTDLVGKLQKEGR